MKTTVSLGTFTQLRSGSEPACQAGSEPGWNLGWKIEARTTFVRQAMRSKAPHHITVSS
jgi:hypothetical protein